MPNFWWSFVGDGLVQLFFFLLYLRSSTIIQFFHLSPPFCTRLYGIIACSEGTCQPDQIDSGQDNGRYIAKPMNTVLSAIQTAYGVGGELSVQESVVTESTPDFTTTACPIISTVEPIYAYSHSTETDENSELQYSCSRYVDQHCPIVVQ